MPTDSAHIACPDCGKLIAPAGEVEDSLRCQCADSDDTDLTESPLVSAEKKCYVCGKSLAGRTRLKDHLGRYWCKECAAADERAKRREEELRCPDCGRVFPAAKLTYFQTTKVCPTCFKAREKVLEKKIIKSNIDKTQKRHELSQLKWLAIIGLGLIILAVVFQLMR